MKFILVIFMNLVICAVNVCKEMNDAYKENDENEPLVLTPLIESGKVKTAKKLALVTPMLNVEISYSGFFNVNPTFNSHMFFWYFPSEYDASSAPVLLWLQGGPGKSGLVGLFLENGPFFSDGSEIRMRSVYWSQVFHVIYVDNPVGTGFSFTDDKGICNNQFCIADNLDSFLYQFFQMFDELKNNDFYIVGQAYACKYIAALGHLIHTKNYFANDKINLKGIAVGNGICDPINMMNHGDHLYQLGIIDENAKKYVDSVKEEITGYIKKKAFEAATKLFTREPILYFLRNVTGFSNCFNCLKSSPDVYFDKWKYYIEQDCVRHSIHVGNNRIQNESKIYQALEPDFMQSVAPWISELAEHYKVLIYSGQLDMIVPYSATDRFLKKLNWSGSKDYSKAKREIWRGRDGDIAGYVKSASSSFGGSVTEVLVRNAGHFVPKDQPEWAFEMIYDFIFGQSTFQILTQSNKKPLKI